MNTQEIELFTLYTSDEGSSIAYTPSVNLRASKSELSRKIPIAYLFDTVFTLDYMEGVSSLIPIHTCTYPLDDLPF